MGKCINEEDIMSAVKERILGAVTVMNENDAQILWNMIAQTFGVNWENI